MITNIAETFEFPVITKMNGLLLFTPLKIIKDELKANVSAIQSDLGGGANGHLGLVCTFAEYANISAIPYIRHVNPVMPIIANNTTQYHANRV